MFSTEVTHQLDQVFTNVQEIGNITGLNNKSGSSAEDIMSKANPMNYLATEESKKLQRITKIAKMQSCNSIIIFLFFDFASGNQSSPSMGCRPSLHFYDLIVTWKVKP